MSGDARAGGAASQHKRLISGLLHGSDGHARKPNLVWGASPIFT